MENNKILLIRAQGSVFNQFRFLIRAMIKVSTRYALNRILITEKEAVATDGHVLHVIGLPPKEKQKPYKMLPGLYEVLRNTAQEIILLRAPNDKFPKWQDRMPEHINYFTIAVYESDQVCVGIILGTLGKYNISIDYRYLLPLGILDAAAKVWFGTPEQPILIEMPSVDAKMIVMPLNIELERIERIIDKNL